MEGNKQLSNNSNHSLGQRSRHSGDEQEGNRKSMNRLTSFGSSGMRSVKPSKEGHCQESSRRSSLADVVGKGFKNTLMAPVTATRFAVNMGAKTTQAVANVTVKSTQLATATVVAGAKGVVGGGNALIHGTGAVVGYGGTAVLSGAKGVVKITKAPWKSFSKGKKQSKWEKGIATIDSLLEPGSATYQSMSDEQREQLALVKKLLIKGSTSSSTLDHATEAEKMAHIPMELLQEQKQSRKGSMTSVSSADPAASNYILQEFAGVRNQTVLSNLNEETSEDSSSSSLSNNEEDIVGEREDIEATDTNESTAPALSKPVEVAEPCRPAHTLSEEEASFVPPQFTALSREDQVELCDMLSWEAITTWGYDIFKLDSLSNGNALLFLSWATVAYPQAQRAMAKACGKQDTTETTEDGYSFVQDFGIVPSVLCNYASAVQDQYHAENPYHNAIHAADVLQTLHTLIQMKGLNSFDPLDVFAILLSAIVHDVNHSGTTNAFHTNLRTELAVMYNDSSVLENWHVACAFACMLGLNLEDASQQHYEALAAPNRPTERNILMNVDTEDFNKIRNRMIEAVLHTDMTKHFAMVNACKALLLQIEEDEEEAACSSWKILMFMLHMADISAQAKPDPLFRHWTVRCMDEFFDQGDLEVRYNLPVSPNCCRESTNIAQSQMGFVKFVVGPAFDVLGGFIPAVESEVLPVIEENLSTWINES